MGFLDFIPADIFEMIGILAGLTACAAVAIQMVKELRDKKPSSLALSYVIGWLFIFLFWLLYGIRFRAMALWLTNSIAVVLQSGLIFAVFRKRNS